MTDPDQVSLNEIIESVLAGKGRVSDESLTRGLRRSFERLLKNIGGDIETIKAGGRIIGFYGRDALYMEEIIRQLYDKKGLISSFAERERAISSEDIRSLIQSLLDEKDKEGADEDELRRFAMFLDRTFQCGLLYSIENCHKHIDFLSMNLSDLTSEEKAIHFTEIEHLLRKEVYLRVAGSASNIAKIAGHVENSEIFGDDNNTNPYFGLNPDLIDEYIERDTRMLRAIQEDEGLRHYIEDKFGRRAEEIFSYALMDE